MLLKKQLLACASVVLLASSSTSSAWAQQVEVTSAAGPVRRVLLISIDGFHAVDYLNCAKGIAGVNNGAPYCPALAALATTGINYPAGYYFQAVGLFPGLDRNRIWRVSPHQRRLL